jgi:hypothetical protein
MTKEELAALLNGRQYREEMTREEMKAAEKAGLVVIYGASDDLMEIGGIVHDEVGAPGEALFTPEGLLRNPCEEERCPYFATRKKKAVPVEAFFDQDGWTWTYKTDIPHATFEILEDDDQYCRGIVFALADVPDRQLLELKALIDAFGDASFEYGEAEHGSEESQSAHEAIKPARKRLDDAIAALCAGASSR